MGRLIIEKEWAQAPNKLVSCKKTSLKAKGLYVYLNSKPIDWDFASYRIASELKESEGCVKSTLKELEENGWLERKKYQNTKGHWKTDYILKAKSLSTKILPKEIPTEEIPTEGKVDNKERQKLSKQENNNKESIFRENENFSEELILTEQQFLELWNTGRKKILKVEHSNFNKLGYNEKEELKELIKNKTTVIEVKQSITGLLQQKGAIESIKNHPKHILSEGRFYMYLDAYRNNIFNLYEKKFGKKDTLNGRL